MTNDFSHYRNHIIIIIALLSAIIATSRTANSTKQNALGARDKKKSNSNTTLIK